MKAHSPEQIQSLREFVNYCATGHHHEIVSNLIDVEYYTVKLEDSAPFKFSVAAAFPELTPETYNDQTHGIIAVDESVPEELRTLWALHEKIDFTVLGHSHPRRCRTSEQIVQLIIDPELNKRYKPIRAKFYKYLGNYALNSALGDTFDKNDISELDYLANNLLKI